eukprot:TRINITY_DN20943_c0_g1_i2.p1 TRINITY_DN20943_c0_g1~~TRINITY_DN20943_c0_g1_i2.p1  ORF type:complete len:643 (+),score=155.07 TRINITY_DN20943_c0_g1_i2:524-2452(+)
MMESGVRLSTTGEERELKETYSKGHVVLGIMACRNLSESHFKKKFAPYVNIHLVGCKHKKLSTNTFKNFSMPTWYEEFVISIIDINNPIKLKVWNDTPGIKESLGQATLLPSSLVPHQTTELWLPLKDTKDKTEGEVNIKVCFTPKPVSDKFSRQIFAKLENFRFLLEKKEYYSGEKILGVLAVNIGQTVAVKDILLNIRGTQAVLTEYTQGNRETVFNKYEVFNLEVPLLKNVPIEGEIISPGFYTFPFRFTLPVGLVPSYTYCENLNSSLFLTTKTTYEFRAKIDSTPRICNTDFITHPFIVQINWGDQLMMQEETRNEGKANITITAYFENKQVISGSLEPLTIEITNGSNLKVHNLYVSLTQKLSVHTKTGPVNSEKKFHRVKYSDKSIFPIHSGKSKKFTIQFPVPPAFPSLSEAMSPLFQVHHCVKIKAMCCGLVAEEVSHSFPVHITKDQGLTRLPPDFQEPSPYSHEKKLHQSDKFAVLTEEGEISELSPALFKLLEDNNKILDITLVCAQYKSHPDLPAQPLSSHKHLRSKSLDKHSKKATGIHTKSLHSHTEASKHIQIPKSHVRSLSISPRLPKTQGNSPNQSPPIPKNTEKPHKTIKGEKETTKEQPLKPTQNSSQPEVIPLESTSEDNK